MNGLFDGLFDGVAEAGPGVAIRATVLLAVAAVVSLAMARASAAQRHLVWVAALLAALALPAIHAWAPAWPVWPTALAGRQATLPAGTESTPQFEPAPPGGPGSPVAAGPVALFESRGAEPAVSQSVSQTASPPAAATARTVSLVHGVAAVWLVGVIYGCLRLAVAYAGIGQLARRADPAGGRTAAMIAELAAAAGIRRRVRGLVSRESIVPMTWGWLRPVVLLPVEAGSWSAERLRVVLQHELAHVSRWDALTQFVAELTRSVYWFHPLAWWSVRRLRADQEAACDDCVLAAGAAADDYAEELLAVTARLPRGAYGLQGTGVAVAMGRAGRLEERVRALLAFDRDRRPVNPWRAAAVASVFAAVATLAAVIGPAADAEDKAASGPAKPSASADDELPEDTNKIESLTPEQARKLAEEFPGVSVEYQLHGFGMKTLEDCFPLNGLTTLSADTAKAIAGFKGRWLMLNGVSEISVESAKELATFKGFALQLDGLTTLSHDAASALAESTCLRLSLDGLPTLNADTAKKLAKFNGDLSLGGLSTLDVATAAALGKSQADTLFLSGLTTLDAGTAKALAKFEGHSLYVSGPTDRNTEAAEAIAGFKGRTLVLTNVTTLDAATAKALAQFKGHLRLNDLATIDADTAMPLAEFTGPGFALPGLTTLDVETATILAASESWDGKLPNLTRIDAAAARVIAQSRAWRNALSELTTLNAATLRVLAEDQSDQLPLFGLTTLDADTAKVLAVFQGSRLNLGGRNALKSLDDASAAALAKFKGRYLSLRGPSKLDAATAKAIAAFKGDLLELDGLTTLDADTAKAFEGFGGSLFFDIDTLDFPDSLAIAQALAKRKGQLALPRLKKISPKTLAALLQKGDVEIPLIETLELIPEPDGSATDDFVIPEGLQQRQKQQAR